MAKQEEVNDREDQLLSEFGKFRQANYCDTGHSRSAGAAKKTICKGKCIQDYHLYCHNRKLKFTPGQPIGSSCS